MGSAAFGCLFASISSPADFLGRFHYISLFVQQRIDQTSQKGVVFLLENTLQ
jgi:hypothetical protein